MKKKPCACALTNGHLPNCPFKNLTAGEKSLEIDFGVLGEMIKEMEKRVLEEDASLDGRKTRIFAAPVIKKRKKKMSRGEEVMKREEFCNCESSTSKHEPQCPLDEVGVDSSDLKKVLNRIEKDYSGPGRNSVRIKKILQRLEKIWLKNPDLRLGQLILNFFMDKKTLYYLEDSELIEELEKMYLKKKKKKAA